MSMPLPATRDILVCDGTNRANYTIGANYTDKDAAAARGICQGCALGSAHQYPTNQHYVKSTVAHDHGYCIQAVGNLYGFPPAGQNFSIEFDKCVKEMGYLNTPWDLKLFYKWINASPYLS